MDTVTQTAPAPSSVRAGAGTGAASVPATVELRAVVALLGTFPALSGMDLRAEAGEVVLLRGANGAGKTTVLRVCAGLVPVQRGTVTVLGSDVSTDRRAVRRRIGLLGHATALYEDLTVEENVRFAVRSAGGDVQGIEPALRRLDLAGRLRTVAVVHLSAGQRRRVALAALVARRPGLWLLDEPHAGLDPDGRDLLDAVVGEVAADGATVLLASHDLDGAGRVATRTVVVAGGRSIAEAPTAGTGPAPREVSHVP